MFRGLFILRKLWIPYFLTTSSDYTIPGQVKIIRYSREFAKKYHLYLDVCNITFSILKALFSVSLLFCGVSHKEFTISFTSQSKKLKLGSPDFQMGTVQIEDKKNFLVENENLIF